MGGGASARPRCRIDAVVTGDGVAPPLRLPRPRGVRVVLHFGAALGRRWLRTRDSVRLGVSDARVMCLSLRAMRAGPTRTATQASLLLLVGVRQRGLAGMLASEVDAAPR